MPSAKINRSIEFPFVGTFNENQTPVSGDSVSYYEITLAALPAANTGTLSTRTDDNTGVCTLSSGHNIVDSTVVDVYWSGGVRYGMTATVSTNDVTVDGGAGDVLPAQTTAVVVCTQTEINPCNLDGDNATFVTLQYRNIDDTGAKAHIDLQDSGSASIHEQDLVHETANGAGNVVWNITGGDTNDFTGNPITKAFASHDSSSAATLYVCALIDSTP